MTPAERAARLEDLALASRRYLDAQDPSGLEGPEAFRRAEYELQQARAAWVEALEAVERGGG